MFARLWCSRLKEALHAGPPLHQETQPFISTPRIWDSQCIYIGIYIKVYPVCFYYVFILGAEFLKKIAGI